MRPCAAPGWLRPVRKLHLRHQSLGWPAAPWLNPRSSSSSSQLFPAFLLSLHVTSCHFMSLHVTEDSGLLWQEFPGRGHGQSVVFLLCGANHSHFLTWHMILIYFISVYIQTACYSCQTSTGQATYYILIWMWVPTSMPWLHQHASSLRNKYRAQPLCTRCGWLSCNVRIFPNILDFTPYTVLNMLAIAQKCTSKGYRKRLKFVLGRQKSSLFCNGESTTCCTPCCVSLLVSLHNSLRRQKSHLRHWHWITALSKFGVTSVYIYIVLLQRPEACKLYSCSGVPQSFWSQKSAGDNFWRGTLEPQALPDMAALDCWNLQDDYQEKDHILLKGQEPIEQVPLSAFQKEVFLVFRMFQVELPSNSFIFLQKFQFHQSLLCSAGLMGDPAIPFVPGLWLAWCPTSCGTGIMRCSTGCGIHSHRESSKKRQPAWHSVHVHAFCSREAEKLRQFKVGGRWVADGYV